MVNSSCVRKIRIFLKIHFLYDKSFFFTLKWNIFIRFDISISCASLPIVWDNLTQKYERDTLVKAYEQFQTICIFYTNVLTCLYKIPSFSLVLCFDAIIQLGSNAQTLHNYIACFLFQFTFNGKFQIKVG